MPDEEPRPLSESIEEALLRLIRPDLLAQYRAEKARHREELRGIELACKRARRMIRRLFGNLREQKEQELKEEYVERIQHEDDRHARFLQELRETIRDHGRPERDEPAEG